MKLNVYLARCGVASRRGADELIKKGKVQVNGKRTLEPYTEIKEDDIVTVRNRPVSPAKYVYIALNKPKGYISTIKDRFAEKKVIDLVPRSYGKLFYVGRLDKNSSGLMILTNDGQFAQHLSHPSFQVEKEYEVFLSPSYDPGHTPILKTGIIDDGEKLRVVSIRALKRFPRRTLLSVVMKEGKKREVRRIFEHFGYRVIDLKRVRIGKILLGETKTGQYRLLTEKEKQVK